MSTKYFILLFLNFAFVDEIICKTSDIITDKAFNARTNFAFQNQFLSNDTDQMKKDQLEPTIVSLDGEIAVNAFIPINDMVGRGGKWKIKFEKCFKSW